ENLDRGDEADEGRAPRESSPGTAQFATAVHRGQFQTGFKEHQPVAQHHGPDHLSRKGYVGVTAGCRAIVELEQARRLLYVVPRPSLGTRLPRANETACGIQSRGNRATMGTACKSSKRRDSSGDRFSDEPDMDATKLNCRNVKMNKQMTDFFVFQCFFIIERTNQDGFLLWKNRGGARLRSAEQFDKNCRQAARPPIFEIEIEGQKWTR